MSKSNYKIPHRSRSQRDRSQREHHYYVSNLDGHSHASYPESESSRYSRNLDTFGLPPYEGSEMSVEEIRREFSPPGAGPFYTHNDDWYDIKSHTRAPSTIESSLYDGYTNDNDSQSLNKKYERSHERRKTISVKASSTKGRPLSRNEIMLAAVGGAALAVGGKELWDRRKSNKRPVKSNPVHTAAIGAAGALAGYEGAEIYTKIAAKEEQKSGKSSSHRGSLTEDEYKNNKNRSRDSDKARRSRSRQRSSSRVQRDSSSTRNSRHDKQTKRKNSHESFDSRGRGMSHESAAQLQQLAKAALLAGATEAFRVRNEPGGWSGDKGKRVLTAAIGASAIDAVADGNGKRHILEAIIGGLASNRLIHGSRHQDDNRSVSSKYRSRSRSRASSRETTGPIAALVSAGMGALTGKMLNKPRSRSRTTTSRRRQESPSSYSSSSSFVTQRSIKPSSEASKSIADLARKGLAALGLAETHIHERHEKTRPHRKPYQSESDSDSTREYSQHRNSVRLDDRRHHQSHHKSSRDKSPSSRRRESRSSRRHRHSNGSRDKKQRSHHTSDSYDSTSSSLFDEKFIKSSRGRH